MDGHEITESRKNCEGIIKLSEVKLVTRETANGKSPESDGFLAEFFINVTGDFLIRSLILAVSDWTFVNKPEARENPMSPKETNLESL